MAKIWHPQSKEVLESWVQAILDEASDKLNDWESNFISDMRIILIYNNSLTQKQEEFLERIYTEKTK